MKSLLAGCTISGAALALSLLASTAARADEISIVTGLVGNDLGLLQEQLKSFEDKTGHTVKVVSLPPSSSDQFSQYRLWLAAGNPDIDVYRTDVVWAPQLADQFIDLTPYTEDVIDEYFPSTIRSQTVDGKLVALPWYATIPGLYYRTDLLEKYGKDVPKTWDEMTTTAREIMDAERADGNASMWGFLFQGAPYEGLTCDGLEWLVSSGGGNIVEADGEISVNNPDAAAALERAKSWIGTISPPGTLSYKEEDTRGIWQLGNAVFMRNWPYAYALGEQDDSAIKGKFDVAPLPAGENGESAATLGGFNLAVSKYSEHPDAAVELVKYLTSPEAQKYRVMYNSNAPTAVALYEDPEVQAKQPFALRWEDSLETAVSRPSNVTKSKYNEVSSLFWTTAYNTLSGNGSAQDNLEELELKLYQLRGNGW
ncbi:ABC transporter substrate-binding protein [Martelella lutilitoris]|uniref:ABC transporter substrate-binding protein n=1 Tax=Martelella lutilitoris TaxID=2583532 RepID=A0A5C4JUQ0_9HYPH|nr:ABC transporter substrate-binding protein [Martelella lutilitoris]TNB49116.1 ABC transporter substrate-binding protein [Martelella lutilitoris]